MNILIVKLSAIGDVIHALPIAYVLKKRYPNAHITWVVEPTAYELVKHNPYVDEIIIFHKKALNHGMVLKKIIDLLLSYCKKENMIYL